MLHFHANVFCEPTESVMGDPVMLRGTALSTLADAEGGPPRFVAGLPVTFEEFQRRLMQIPRMDIEPDGYFLVAGGEQQGNRWQIDGHMHEYNAQMHRVEMHGSCPEATLDALLGCFGWPACSLVFQLVHEGVTLSETEFRKFARSEPTR